MNGNLNATPSVSSFPSSLGLSLERLREEARELVCRGIIARHQPLYVLCEFLPAREWLGLEKELELNGYLLRDRIVDLLGSECWDSD